MIDKRSVYLIDDDPIVNVHNKDVLNELNCFKKIEEYSSGPKALSKISSLIKSNSSLPGYIFLDVRMPEMDGFEFIDELEYLLDDNDLNEFPVVLIVTSSKHKRDLELFDKCRTAGYYIEKPLRPEVIRETLNLEN